MEGHIRNKYFHNDSLRFISAIFLHLFCLGPLSVTAQGLRLGDSLRRNRDIQVLDGGSTGIISEVLTTIFPTGRKILKTTLDVLETNC